LRHNISPTDRPPIRLSADSSIPLILLVGGVKVCHAHLYFIGIMCRKVSFSSLLTKTITNRPSTHPSDPNFIRQGYRNSCSNKIKTSENKHKSTTLNNRLYGTGNNELCLPNILTGLLYFKQAKTTSLFVSESMMKLLLIMESSKFLSSLKTLLTVNWLITLYLINSNCSSKKCWGKH